VNESDLHKRWKWMRAIWRRLKIRVLGVGLPIQDFGESYMIGPKKQ